MQAPKSVGTLEKLGRVRLSQSFFLRDFLHSEIANFYGLQNIPENPDLAIEVGKQLCEQLIEPLNATFGRIAIRSAYRSPTVNAHGNKNGHSCGSNQRNYARHIWDYNDTEGFKGAMACIVIPWFADRYAEGSDWRAMAYWIHNHLPYSELEFFPKLAAFNIGWHEKPKRAIYSYIKPKGLLLRGEGRDNAFSSFYDFFPKLQRV